MGFGLASDTHNHAWSAFSTTNSDGVNSRLQIILDETWRAAVETKEAGHEYFVHGGDLFHVRGEVKPSVLNPTAWLYRRITEVLGLKVVIIPGNHDLEGNESSKLSNASQVLAESGAVICSAPTIINDNIGPKNKIRLALIPWAPSVPALLEQIDAMGFELDKTHGGRSHFDLIIHAPVDGVIAGIPDHGLTAEMLEAFGFKRVFCGHYHNHKHFDGTSVYSIGALTHQTWGDVNSKAGFLLVSDEGVTYRASRAPRFIDLDASTAEDEVPLLVDGNYVRVRMEVERESQISEMRELLESFGAKGVVIHPIREPKAVERRSSVKAGASIEASINEFIKAKGFRDQDRLNKHCAEILNEVEASE